MKRFVCLAIVTLLLGLGGCGQKYERAEVPQSGEARKQTETPEGSGGAAREDTSAVPGPSGNGSPDAGAGEAETEADNSAGGSAAGNGGAAEDGTAAGGGAAGRAEAEGSGGGAAGRAEAERSGGGAAGRAEAEGSGSRAADAGGFSFADVEGWTFYFGSGAGAWSTVLDIYADGRFEGFYHDANMGETGEGYPNGTVYRSDFSGHFTDPEQVDDTTCVFQIADISYAHETGQEINSEEGVLYVYTDAYGLEGAENLYLYLPGSELTKLPEYFLNWTGYANYDREALERYRLPYYGIFNEAAQEGFSSAVHKTEMTAAEQIWTRINAAQSRSSDAEYELYEVAGQSQDELAEAASGLYSVWDDALNDIWAILKADLDEETMSRLTAEERDWIREKEAAVKDTEAKYEDDASLAGIQSSVTAANLTQERVYELAEYGR